MNHSLYRVPAALLLALLTEPLHAAFSKETMNTRGLLGVTEPVPWRSRRHRRRRQRRHGRTSPRPFGTRGHRQRALGHHDHITHHQSHTSCNNRTAVLAGRIGVLRSFRKASALCAVRRALFGISRWNLLMESPDGISRWNLLAESAQERRRSVMGREAAASRCSQRGSTGRRISRLRPSRHPAPPQSRPR